MRKIFFIHLSLAIFLLTFSAGASWAQRSWSQDFAKAYKAKDKKGEWKTLWDKHPTAMFWIERHAGKNPARLIENGKFDRKIVEKTISGLKNPSAFKSALQSCADDKQLLALFEETVEALKVQERLENVNLAAIKRSVDFMTKKHSGFSDQGRYQRIKDGLPKAKADLYARKPGAVKRAMEIVELKKELLLSTPLLKSDILVTRHELGKYARRSGAPGMGMPGANWKSNANTNPKRGRGEVGLISGMNQADVNYQTVYKAEGSHVADLELNFDADKMMFSKAGPHGRWHLYEMPADGGEPKLLTPDDVPEVDFMDGTYLPSGKIMLTSNLSLQGVPCVNGNDAVALVSVMDPATKKVRQLSYGQDNEWDPVVLNNGRVMYLRWEYTDMAHYFARNLLHMNPDGTGKKEYYGSGSYWPNSFFDARPVPGHPTKIVGIVSGHHGVARAGRLVILDPMKGRKEAEGVVQEIPGYGKEVIPEIKDRLVDGVWPQFVTPYPLSEEYYLVSAKMSPNSLWGIYLVDIFDNMTLIAEAEGAGMRSPILKEKKPTPRVIPDQVNLTKKTANVYIQDIYQGPGLAGVPRGSVKELRLFTYKFVYNRTLGDHFSAGIESGWDVKRIMGTVPVEEDGSAFFQVPANTPISMQPLDEKGRAMQLMRSWMTAMPGETVSCVGCHEDRNTLPIAKPTIASRKSKPAKIKPWYGETRPMTFMNEIQPTLDRKCVSCHDGKDSHRPNFADTTMKRVIKSGVQHWYTKAHMTFGKSYWNLHPYIRRPGPESDQTMLTPMDFHASLSPLVQMLEKGHHNVELSEEEWDRLNTWIDLNVPFHGEYNKSGKFRSETPQEVRRKELALRFDTPIDNSDEELARARARRWAQGPVTPVLPEKEAPVKHKRVKAKKWPFTADMAGTLQEKAKTADGSTKTIDLGEGISIKLVRIPAGSFVMGSEEGSKDEYPRARVKVEKAFWMGAFEISNEQFRKFFPEHDSRHIDQQWKDHVFAGYPANKPEQPAIRVTWKEAMAFCQKLSEKTGMQVTLPTEAQWEWACRAGSGSDMWYGTQSTDFSAFANLADVSLQKLAVNGVDPKPVGPDHPVFRSQDFVPKVEAVDDGVMVPSGTGQYKPNAWGLYDMHGNVAEWTASDYAPYPYKAKDGRNDLNENNLKAIRGGSWRDLPKRATASYRLGFQPWQKIFNVGFRIVVLDDPKAMAQK
ncbi:hypothetical protein FUAX_05500 [Fulvitalea axinellae]|uniref:Formylglycine-generating enzyme family protein n=1 Tax=Fulvitalea axinellae TaxID=1182444 RepID=A0AAU9CJF2_9BACT|nr:hypothetical protein FUAX_05500 [Fulvitalea axinellae]